MERKNLVAYLLILVFCVSCSGAPSPVSPTPPAADALQALPADASATPQIEAPSATTAASLTPSLTSQATLVETDALPSATTQPTNTVPPPTATVQVNTVAFDFQELIRFGEGGGGGGCEPFQRPLPLIDKTFEFGYPERQNFWACLIGFPGGDQVALSVIGPNGQETEWVTVRVPEVELSGATYNETFTQVLLPGFKSLALQSPNWQLNVVDSGLAYSNTLFDPDAGLWWNSTDRVVTHSPVPPGSITNPFAPSLRRPYKYGDTLYLQGVNFTPNIGLPLGIYKGFVDMEFVDAFSVPTDASGSFSTQLTIGSGFTDGFYSIIPSEMFLEDQLDSPETGSFASFHVLNQKPYEPCAGANAPPSNLTVGDRARMVDSVANNLRAGAGIYDFNPVTGIIQQGETVRILYGPSCEQSNVWWLVRNENTNQIGWTAEGSADTVWLAPVE